MKNLVDSLIRTWTPIIVGALAAWLITKGIVLNPEIEAGLLITITATLQGLYYAIIRIAERYFPKVGILLGKAKTPDYR